MITYGKRYRKNNFNYKNTKGWVKVNDKTRTKVD